MPTPTSRKPRRGSALMWALLLVAIFTSLAAIIASSVAQTSRYADAVKTAQMLDDLTVAITAFETNVASGNNRNNYPGLISELTNRVRNGQPTSCSVQTMNATDSSNWVNNGGPYLRQFYIDTSGFLTPLGHINDRVQRLDTNARGVHNLPAANPIFLVIPNMDIRDANLLNQIVDQGVNDGGTGDTLQYDATKTDTVTVFWRFSIPTSEVTKC